MLAAVAVRGVGDEELAVVGEARGVEDGVDARGAEEWSRPASSRALSSTSSRSLKRQLW